MVPNTVRRHGVFYFRRAIPGDIRRLLDRAELCCRLLTTDVGRARGLSRCLYLRSEALFESARLSPMLTRTELARMVQDCYVVVLAPDNRFRIGASSPLDEATGTPRTTAVLGAWPGAQNFDGPELPPNAQK